MAQPSESLNLTNTVRINSVFNHNVLGLSFGSDGLLRIGTSHFGLVAMDQAGIHKLIGELIKHYPLDALSQI